MLHRACALFEVKSVNDDDRIIEGIATATTPDRSGDIIESSGAQFALPLPLLWQHDQKQPIGEVIAASVTPTEIRIRAKFASVAEPGRLKDRLDEAWQSIKAGLVRGLSIGWKPLEVLPVKGAAFGLHVTKWLWAELSVVTIPANVDATILRVKDLAAIGRAAPRDGGLPIVSALKVAHPMTTTEQITAFENTRAAKAARMTALMQKAADAGVTLDAAETEDYDTLEAELKSIDAHLVRLRTLEKSLAASAKPVEPLVTVPRTTPILQVKSQVPPGTAFVRAACAALVCKGNMFEAAEYAKRWDDSTPEVSLSLKAAIAPGTATDATWAGPLVNQAIAKDFLELLRPATILGKVPGLRLVPFNTKVPSQTAGGTYGWVGEGKPKPVTKLAFGSDSLGMTKVAGIIVLTEELVRLSSPSAEDLARRDMVAGIARFLDSQFIDPAVAAVAGVNPASITNGAPTAAATTSPLADILGLVQFFSSNNVSIEGLTFIMSPSNALAIAFATNTDGSPKFPGMSASGGSIKGINIVTSQAAGGNIIGVQPDLILYADDGGVTIDASREASLQMDSAPMAPADATVVMVSLWQNNLVGLRAERFVNWKRASAYAVKYLTAAAYPAPALAESQIITP